ncbi:leucyl aminopeptidase [Sphingomonas sp. BN140010]|uniref:Probable cytosol aminopeptidase n=1 Tax=Sphingomonas arvum TaxID=2992113 RepID=A0ABT3JI96_9SPHN|nr:leucyl aminopeptidase [Sphingomonas sp. BN140010]MCW3798679.1 leucyl aminopeptidase [Sphingomonas sp. BN140010]
MQIRFSATRPEGSHALVLPVAGIDRAGLGVLGAARQSVEAAARLQRFEGEAGGSAESFIDEGGTARRVLLVGLGASGEDAAEKLGGTAVAKLLLSGETSAVIDLSGARFGADAAAKVALAASLRAWRHDRYRTRLKERQKPTLTELVIVGAADGAEARWTERYEPVLKGACLTRELVAEPANIIYPESFVERCRAAMDGTGLEIEVLDGPAMEELGMGALLGVAQGSVREPRLLVMRWNGGGEGGQPIALIGKGVTFDTGGISIKPAAGMESMKWDMGGAGAVAGAMLAIAGRKAKANVVGLCGLVENMPDGNAQRPGDVVTSMSGQTVEVINTDAEGRLVLGDVMTYAQRTYQPKLMVDLATLTGAMVISLGHEYAGVFSNDDGLANDLLAAGQATGDKLWRMPIGEAYDRLIDSPIADIKNVGPREGGSITAAQFLQRFVENGTKWAHLDVAGVVWSDKPGTTYDKGATSFGVRLLDAFVEATAER